MLFTEITPSAQFILTRNSDVILISEYAEFVSEYRPVALAEMQIDIEFALRFEHNDTVSLNAIAAQFADVLNNALGYKMLEHYYTRYNDGDGMMAERYKMYRNEYEKLKANFGQMYGRTVISPAFSVPISRG